MSNSLSDRLRLVSQTWEPHQRLHVGNVAWAHSRGDGSPAPDVTMAWGEPLFGFADIWQRASAGGRARASVHVSPTASPRQRALAIQDLLAAVPLVSLEASRHDADLVATLRANGFREGDGPWSVHCGGTSMTSPT